MAINRINDFVHTDDFGNAYLNRKDTRILNSFRGYPNNTYTYTTQAPIVCNALNLVSTTNGAFILNITFPGIDNEIHTLSTAGRRFQGSLSAISSSSTPVNLLSLTTANSSASTPVQSATVNMSGFSSNITGSSQYLYITLSTQNACMFLYDAVTSRYKFMSFGWLYRTLNFDPSIYRFANAYCLYSGSTSTGAISTGGLRGNFNDTSVTANLATSGYTINCADSQTPSSSWVTNLALFDQDYLNLNIGVTDSNLLLAQGSYTVGDVYELPPVGNNISAVATNNNPNTDVKTYMCVGNWGTNFLLMRTLTFGYV